MKKKFEVVTGLPDAENSFELSMKGEVIQELPFGSICGLSSIEFGYKTKGLFPEDAVIRRMPSPDAN